jgi:MerR family transcriptional regulator, light-induced transcriptional regulator
MSEGDGGGSRGRRTKSATAPDAADAYLGRGVKDQSRLTRYTVRAAARRLGVPTATLRSWTHRYGVGPLERASGKHRLYTESDISALEHMSALIAEGVNARSAANAAMQTLIPPRMQTTPLLAAMFALDELTASQIIERHLCHYGVLETWESLIRPAFAEIESQQAAGERCIDVEHLLTWTVVSCLQRLPLVPNGISASVILACTEQDTHTLALEALRAALSERDHAAVMLGAAVPAAAVIDALKRRSHPIPVVLWAQTTRTADAAAVKALRAARTRVLVAGPGWDTVRLPAAVLQLHSLDDAVQRLTASD